jgi:TonB family protein
VTRRPPIVVAGTQAGRRRFGWAAAGSLLLHVGAAGVLWAWGPALMPATPPAARDPGGQGRPPVQVAFVRMDFGGPRAPVPVAVEASSLSSPGAPAAPVEAPSLTVEEAPAVATPVTLVRAGDESSAVGLIFVSDSGAAATTCAAGGSGGGEATVSDTAAGAGGATGLAARMAEGAGGFSGSPGPESPRPAAPPPPPPPPPLEAEVLLLPAPEYPPRSRRLGEEGTVLLEIEVLPDGAIGQVRVVEAPAYPRLVSAAIEAVRQARFRPASRNGVPVSSSVEVPIRFRLD